MKFKLITIISLLCVLSNTLSAQVQKAVYQTLNVSLIEVLSARPFLVPNGAPLAHATDIFDLEFSPDSRRLVTSPTGRSLQLWNVATGSSVALGDPKLPRMHGYVRFSPDGQRLLVSIPTMPSMFAVVEADTGALVGPLIRPGAGIVRAEFLPDGSRFVAAGLGGLSIWDARTATLLETPVPMTNTFRHLTISPDGRHALAVADDAAAGRPVLLNLATMKAWPFPNAANSNFSLLNGWFSPDSGRLLTGGISGCGQIWDLATGRELTPPLQQRDTIFSGAWLPGGQRVITGSLDTTAQMWDATTGAKVGPPLQHKSVVYVIKPSPDGRFFATGADGFIRLWRATDGAPAFIPIRHASDTMQVTFSADGRRLATGARDGTVIVWRVPEEAEMARDPATLAVVQAALKSAGKNAAPEWLADLAEELAGRAISGPNRVPAFTARKRYADVRRSVLAAEPDTFTRWARWLLHEPPPETPRQ